ncbi:MAG: hypothetical protein WA962_13380 [Ornithinimicrobium sp.]
MGDAEVVLPVFDVVEEEDSLPEDDDSLLVLESDFFAAVSVEDEPPESDPDSADPLELPLAPA